jgi:hypothetical protein
MQVVELFSQQKIAIGFTHMVEITHADLTQASNATAQVLQALPVNPGDVVQEVATRLVETFEDTADAANNTNTVEIGDDGTTNRFLASQELNKNGSNVTYKAGTGTRLAYTVADTVDVKFNAPAAGKNLLALNKGKLHVFIRVANLATAS